MRDITKKDGNILNLKLILDFIQSNNLTKKDFCKQCNIDFSTFYKIINGKNYKLLSLFKIANKIQVPVCHLFK